MKENLIIIGAGGHGKVAADIAMAMKQWETISFLDDDGSKKRVMGIEVVGNLADVKSFIRSADCFVAIGANDRRKEIVENLISEGAHIPSLIHPKAVIGSRVMIDIGTIIMAGVVINSCTTIGKACIINTGATIDHESIIGDFVHIAPGASLAGNVVVGNNSRIGIGSTIANQVKIANDCDIGAGSLVVKDICHPGVYVGSPARKHEK